MNLDEVIRRYLLDCRRRGLSDHTQRNYRDMLTDLFRTLGNRPITNITLEDLRSWIDGKYDRGLSRYSIWSAVVIVRSFFNWCVSEGILQTSPARRLKPPRLPRPQPKALEEEDIQRLLQAARSGKHPERDEAILLFMLETGARLSAGHGTVVSVRERVITEPPPPPYTTATLLQDAIPRLGWTAAQVMETAQRLFEQGLITYPSG